MAKKSSPSRDNTIGGLECGRKLAILPTESGELLVGGARHVAHHLLQVGHRLPEEADQAEVRRDGRETGTPTDRKWVVTMVTTRGGGAHRVRGVAREGAGHTGTK